MSPSVTVLDGVVLAIVIGAMFTICRVVHAPRVTTKKTDEPKPIRS